MTYFWVGLGGCIGATLRFFLSKLFLNFSFSPILLVNLLGSFIIGIFLKSAEQKLNNPIFIFLLPGVLGGFTTFSTFSAEALIYLRDGFFLKSISYLLTSVFGGLILCAAGYGLSHFLFFKES